MGACQTISQRLAPYRTSGVTWEQAVAAAISAGIDLQAKGYLQITFLLSPQMGEPWKIRLGRTAVLFLWSNLSSDSN